MQQLTLRNKKVDAFVVAGYPTGAIVELILVPIKLVPIDGAGAKKLTDKYGFSHKAIFHLNLRECKNY